MTAQQLIEAALAAPKTHAVVTTYADGAVKRFETRNAASAENHATGERRKIGRDLISRGDTRDGADAEGHRYGDIVRVVSVEVVAL